MIQRYSQFWYFRKGCGNSFSTTRKIFFMLYFINWTNLITWLPLHMEILGNMCMTRICFPECDVINFEINLIFLITPFFYMTKKWRQNFKYLEKEKSFQGEIKSIFHYFYRAFGGQRLTQTWECAFNDSHRENYRNTSIQILAASDYCLHNQLKFHNSID